MPALNPDATTQSQSEDEHNKSQKCLSTITQRKLGIWMELICVHQVELHERDLSPHFNSNIV